MSDIYVPVPASGSSDDGVRRDRWGRYLVVPPEGGDPIPYRRTTTVVKALDAEGALVPWAQSRAMLGLVHDQGVLRRWRALVKRTGDPWYAGREAKAEAKLLVTEAASAGGDGTARDRGTWLHGCAERAVLGLEQLPTFSDLDAAWLEQLHRALADAGVVIDPGRDGAWIEAVVVHDQLRVAGKADYLVVDVPGYAKPMVGDLKTGDSLEWSINGYAMQLAIYASADARYSQGPAADGSEDQRHLMPELNREHGLVIHAPQSGGPVALWIVDLKEGRVAFELALLVERWRACSVATVLDVDLSPALEASVVLAQTANLRAWLQARIDLVGTYVDARVGLQAAWPLEVPPLRTSDEHSLEQLEAIEAALDSVERQYKVPFPQQRPATDVLEAQRLAPVLEMFPGTEVVPE